MVLNPSVLLHVTLNGEEHAMDENIVLVLIVCVLLVVLGLQIQIRNISKKMDELLRK